MPERWIRAALIAALVYFVVGRLFALPATDVQFWRLAAWAVSGIVFAAQIGYEHFVLRNRPRPLAFHAAVAAAIGALALAVAGFLHSLAGTPRTGLWMLALVVWPLATAIPAFLVAFVLGVILGRVAPHRRA